MIERIRNIFNKRIVLAVFFGFLGVVLFLKFLDVFVQLPPDVKRIVSKIIPSRQFHKLVVVDPFAFDQKGYHKTYILDPRYMDVFTIGFFSVKGELPENYAFNGKIKIEYNWGPKMRFEQVVSSGSVSQPLNMDLVKRRKVVLKNFDLRLKENYNDPVTITLTVLSADSILSKYKNALRLYIEVKRIQ